jgi:hypothetical protein
MLVTSAAGEGPAAKCGGVSMNRLMVLLVAALLVAGCSSSPSTLPAETVPPTPAAPAGWMSIGAFAGTGGGGSVGTSLPLAAGHAAAIHVSCTGLGTLVVQFGNAPAPAYVFPCGGHTVAQESRLELTNMTITSGTEIIASVTSGPADLYDSSFSVSIEQKS